MGQFDAVRSDKVWGPVPAARKIAPLDFDGDSNDSLFHPFRSGRPPASLEYLAPDRGAFADVWFETDRWPESQETLSEASLPPARPQASATKSGDLIAGGDDYAEVPNAPAFMITVKIAISGSPIVARCQALGERRTGMSY